MTLACNAPAGNPFVKEFKHSAVHFYRLAGEWNNRPMNLAGPRECIVLGNIHELGRIQNSSRIHLFPPCFLYI